MQEHFWKAIIGGGVAGLSLVTTFVAQVAEHSPPSLNTVSAITLNGACVYAVVHMYRLLTATQKAAAEERVNHATAIAAIHASYVVILREDAQRAEASRSALQTTIEGLRADLKR